MSPETSTPIPSEIREQFHRTIARLWDKEIHVWTDNRAPPALSTPPTIQQAELDNVQRSDPTISRVHHVWNRRQCPTSSELSKEPTSVRKLLRSWDRIIERSGILYRKATIHGRKVDQLLLLSSLRKQVLTEVHNKSGVKKLGSWRQGQGHGVKS